LEWRRSLFVESVIEEMIKERPHLTEPLRFYGRALGFFNAAGSLPPLQGPTRTSYPREVLNTIFERFSSFIELPEGSLDPLKQAMELGEIDFTRLPLGEVPAFSLPYAEDDLSMLLFLLSKPYFIALRESRALDDRTWEGGRCPVCRAQPAVSWIADNGRRRVSCSYCGTTGHVDRFGCPICQAVDASKQNILVFEREKGFLINTCERCRSYVKTVDVDMILRMTPELADLVSLPLDIVVQEKGYVRRSPSPIGMRKISTRG
jgi:FdhE protein